MIRKLTALVAFSVFAVGLAASASPAAAAGQSHTGERNATHMELKNSSGGIVCAAYDTSSSAKPVARNCPNGTFIEQLFNSSWDQIGQRKVTIGNGGGGRVNVSVPNPAAHMELKDGRTVVCSAYNTDPTVGPTAKNCPYGAYMVYLFDSNWNQIGQPELMVLRERG